MDRGSSYAARAISFNSQTLWSSHCVRRFAEITLIWFGPNYDNRVTIARIYQPNIRRPISLTAASDSASRAGRNVWVVRAVCLDACDREIMTWSATTDGVCGATVRATAQGLWMLFTSV